MRATELRIGNKLFRGGVVVDIDARSIFDIWENDPEEYGYRPIPLNEDWLLKFGFSRTIYSKDSGYKQYGKGRSNFDFMFSIECNERPQFYLSNIRVKIDNVHQLQNLYFALTGEELTLNKDTK